MAVPPGRTWARLSRANLTQGDLADKGRAQLGFFCPVHRGGWNILAVFAAEEGTFVADTWRFRRRTVRITHGEKVVLRLVRPRPAEAARLLPDPLRGSVDATGRGPTQGAVRIGSGMRVPPCRPGRWRKAAGRRRVRRRIIRERLVGYPGCCGGLAGIRTLDQLIKSQLLYR